jgi:type IV pilus assembly protein PilC
LLWSYTAIDPEGQIKKDSREAESRYALLQETKAEGLTIITVHEEEGATKPTGMHGLQIPVLPIRSKVITLFTRQLSDLCDAGIPLTESLRSLASFESSKRFAEVLEDVHKRILQGQSFSESLKSHPKEFTNIYVAMVKVGETTGHLPSVLAGLAEFRERDEDLKSRLKGALSYPIFTLGFSMILVWALVAHVLPGFIPIWKGSGLDLHRYPITEFLLKLSDLTHTPLDEIALAVSLIILAFFYRALMAAPQAQHARDAFVLKIPVVREFIEMGAVARICNTLGVMVRSGVGLVKSIELSAQTIENTVYREALAKVSQDIQEGNSFSAALKNQDAFPPMMRQMVGIGEQSGKLDEMFTRMADYYDRQLDGSLKSLVALMEPLTMVFVGGIVFVFVLGIFMPIMGIITALNNQIG